MNNIADRVLIERFLTIVTFMGIIPILFLIIKIPAFSLVVVTSVIIALYVIKGDKKSSKDTKRSQLFRDTVKRNQLNRRAESLVNGVTRAEIQGFGKLRRSNVIIPTETKKIPGIQGKIRICCYQTARLNERYCPCGRAVDPEIVKLEAVV